MRLDKRKLSLLKNKNYTFQNFLKPTKTTNNLGTTVSQNMAH